MRPATPPAITNSNPGTEETKRNTASNDNKVRFLLRQDFTDIGLISSPNPNDKATGASLGYSGDQVAKNDALTLHGAAIAGYTFDYGYGPDETINLIAGSIGAYSTIDKLSNSSSKFTKQNRDIETFGGVGELAFDHIAGGEDWIRFKAGGVDDHIKNTSSLSSAVELVPVYPDYFIHTPHYFNSIYSQFGIRFDPELRVQYDRALANGQTLLFSNQADALRIGPQATILMRPFADITNLNNLNLSLTYHWSFETYSRRELSWFQAAGTYNLDSSGLFGLTASYQRGSDEDAGTNTNIYRVTLTSKLDYCIAGPECTSPLSR